MTRRQAAPETHPRHAGERNRARRRPSSTQGRIQPRTAAGLAKENQVEPTKRTENPNREESSGGRSGAYPGRNQGSWTSKEAPW